MVDGREEGPKRMSVNDAKKKKKRRAGTHELNKNRSPPPKVTSSYPRLSGTQPTRPKMH
jgi:hypothetical protein